jgi:hypothetical protein
MGGKADAILRRDLRQFLIVERTQAARTGAGCRQPQQRRSSSRQMPMPALC